MYGESNAEKLSLSIYRNGDFDNATSIKITLMVCVVVKVKCFPGVSGPVWHADFENVINFASLALVFKLQLL